MIDSNAPETNADLLRKLAAAYAARDYARSQLERLRQYRSMSPGMKNDRQRHYDAESAANEEIARINTLVRENKLPGEPSTVPFNALRKPAEDMLNSYLRLAESGDAGNWNPEEEPEVINLRAALAAKDEPWFSMDDAPRDASHVILAFANAPIPYACSCFWDNGWAFVQTGVSVKDEPTGWQYANLPAMIEDDSRD